MPRPVFHLLPNAHLDPVWLWDWREGLNEAIVTTRTVLDLMDEFEDLTFIRGEAALYRHIEQHDPETFGRVKRLASEGRWDVVGGTFVQPDMNMPATETLLRHFLESQRYFADRFGKAPTVAFAADSFGHSAGIPEILAAAGMEGFAFGRPLDDVLPLSKPAFLWEAASGARILTCRVPVWWYGTERDEIPRRLDASLESAQQFGMTNLGVFIGLGDHGGGPTRRQLQDVKEWTGRHPDVEVRYSTLHALFGALRGEAAQKGETFLAVMRGELNPIMRGCYVSAARFKFAYRRAEAAVTRAETLDAVSAALLARRASDLGEAWRAILFNSFHDILPGSSIERAYDDQVGWLGGAVHAAQCAELGALNALALTVDTRVRATVGDSPSGVAILAFNPHPRAWRGPLEIEGSLDYRLVKREVELPVELRGPAGEAVPHQVVQSESSFATSTHAWRKRVAFQAEIPALGWTVYELGWRKDAENPMAPGHRCSADNGGVANGLLSVSVHPGDSGVSISGPAGDVLGPGGLHAVTVEDAGGSWGSTEAVHSTIRHTWKVTAVEVAEGGPERALLRVRMQGGLSRLDLEIALWRGRDAVDVGARLLWLERAARLKLVFPLPGRATTASFEVPGGVIERSPAGEVPGGRWVRVRGTAGGLGFASDALYGFDLTAGTLRASVVRGSRYADDSDAGPDEHPWRARMDQGEHRFRFLLTRGGPGLEELAAGLERPPLTLLVAPHPGRRARAGSIASVEPRSARLLALKPAADARGFIIRLQDMSGEPTQPVLHWMEEELALGSLFPWQIVTWRLLSKGRRWQAVRSDALERQTRR